MLPNPPLIDFDWWELTNTGPTAVNLTGYQWEDSTSLGDQAIFPAATIAAGESIIIHENDIIGGTIRIADEFRAAWGLSSSVQLLEEPDFTGPNPFSGLSSGGDVVSLFDPAGNLVDSVSFPAATAGVTFEWGTNGSSLGLSVDGENGAFLSNYGGVGSPGTAVVPEPAAMTMMLFLLAGLACRR